MVAPAILTNSSSVMTLGISNRLRQKMKMRACIYEFPIPLY
jgi:hypothetical protein